MSVADALNDACVPMPLPETGHSATGDKDRFPWLMSDTLNYRTEAMLWLDWIEQNYADCLPVSVAALHMANFGRLYASAFAEAAAVRPDVVCSTSWRRGWCVHQSVGLHRGQQLSRSCWRRR